MNPSPPPHNPPPRRNTSFKGDVLRLVSGTLGYTDEALDLMLTLKQRALRHGGDFTLLWHNSYLMIAKDQEFYQALVA
jgi:hypothetical protein